MTKFKKGLIMAVGAALVSTSAFAGQTQPAIVDVDLDNFFASGDLITARTAKDDDVFIGCGARTFDDNAGGVFAFGFCQAEDADGDRALCTTTNTALVEAIRGLADSSFVTYSWTDDGTGNLTCSRIGHSTQSFYLDKHTAGNTKGNEN